MKKKQILCAVALIMIMACFCGCGTSKATDYDESIYMTEAVSEEYVTDDLYTNEYEMETPQENAESTDTGSADVPEAASNRKLIKNVSMKIETESFDKLIANIEKKTEELGGYAESTNINGTGYYDAAGSRYATMTIRIPSKNMKQFVTAVSKESNVISKNENVEDITLRYVDTKAHVESLKIEQERLQELLKESKDLDTIITLERRMTEVRYELEGYESQIRTYDNLVDYSTINLNISEVNRLTPTTEEKLTRLDKIKIGFAMNLIDVCEGFLDFVAGMIIAIPYFIVVIVIVLVVLLIVKLCIRSSKKKKNRIAQRKLTEQNKVEQTSTEQTSDENQDNGKA